MCSRPTSYTQASYNGCTRASVARSRGKVVERIRPRVKLNLNSSYRYRERVLFDSSQTVWSFFLLSLFFSLFFAFLLSPFFPFSALPHFFSLSFFQTEVVMLFSGSVKSYFACERINSPLTSSSPLLLFHSFLTLFFLSSPSPHPVFQFFFPFFSLLCSHSALSAFRRETWFTEVTFYAEFSRAKLSKNSSPPPPPPPRSVNAVSKCRRAANVFPLWKERRRASVLHALLLKRDSGLTELIEKFCCTAVEIGY